MGNYLKRFSGMNKSEISCVLNHSMQSENNTLRGLDEITIASRVDNFHKSLPNYSPTPTANLSLLANKLGIKQILIKDESYRFDLNAFKVLGASFAVAKHLAKVIGLPEEKLSYEAIIACKKQYQNTTFVTATDGNHGRAVAWAAKLFACDAVVYMPKGSSLTRLNAISAYGATASITELNYDNTVTFASQQAQQNGWALLQDTAWDAYTKVPQDIMMGYFTLISETLQQNTDFWPSHVFLQAGVGSLPAAIVAHMCGFKDKPIPKFIVVEPDAAACLYASAEQATKSAVRINGDLNTIMAGLACGEPSTIAWEILHAKADAFLSCSDDVARKGMRVLGNPLKGDCAVISGESGAVTLGALFEILSDPRFKDIKDKLALNATSRVLLLSTEGDTDPAIYRDIVWG